MREMKFRAWDGIHMYNSPVELNHIGNWFNAHWPYAVTMAVPKLMQFTGLRDKNGVEIYEGDVIDLYWLWAGKYYLTEVIWVSELGRWAMEELREDGRGPYHYFGSQDTNLMDIDVIGNIYEHPHLIS